MEKKYSKEIKELASLMRESNYTTVLTGAGMDTESNIPDFRGKEGWWRKIDPRTVANIDTFYDNYPLFHEFYKARVSLLKDCKPHRGHIILAEMEKKEWIQSIATQNVSGLHKLAGSNMVYELHGNIQRIRCNSCYNNAEMTYFLENKGCSSCGKKTLRPNVVLFGETLPEIAWNKALRDVEKADLLIVIGTSLEVYPVNQIPNMARGKTVFINNEVRGENYGFDITIIRKAKEVLEELWQKLI